MRENLFTDAMWLGGILKSLAFRFSKCSIQVKNKKDFKFSEVFKQGSRSFFDFYL
jgi:hypothetical protein